MKKEEIKQTQIFNFFSNNKKTSASNRSILEDNKYSSNYLHLPLVKRSLGKKEKYDISDKTVNMKIKDFFSFREFPEYINDIQKDLKNMLINSDSNNNNNYHKSEPIRNTYQIKISSFNQFFESKNSFNNNIYSENNENHNIFNDNKYEIFNNNNDNKSNNNNINPFNKNNNSNDIGLYNNNNPIGNNNFNYNNNNFNNKKNLYGINKYFPIIDNNNRQDFPQSKNQQLQNTSSIFNNKNNKDNFNNAESDKVFTLDHFNNITKSINEDNLAKINPEYSSIKIKPEGNKSIEINYEYETPNQNLNININKNPILNKSDIENCYTHPGNKYINNDLNLTEKYEINKIEMGSKKNYQDVRITNFINISEPPNMKLNREYLVNVLEFVDLRNLINKVPQICRFWNDLYNKTISSANYNTKIDFRDSSKINEREIKILFKKGKNLKHIKILRDIISEDFGGIKGIGNFLKKMELIMQLSDPKYIHYKGVMLSSFKIKPRGGFELNNFISNKSINLICENSKNSLKTLILRNCSKLNNRVFDGISLCEFLSTLEISFNE
jgi:hypothetical protein